MVYTPSSDPDSFMLMPRYKNHNFADDGRQIIDMLFITEEQPWNFDQGHRQAWTHDHEVSQEEALMPQLYELPD
jgi:hypothetical protein